MTSVVAPPLSRNPEYLPLRSKRILNNTMSNLIITPTWSCGFCIMLINFIIFGSLAYVFYMDADNLNVYELRYDEQCASVRGTGQTCLVRFTPDVDLTNPKVYYRLNNFYQNHRSFQKYSYGQLRGDDEDKVKIGQCGPVTSNLDMLTNREQWDVWRNFPTVLSASPDRIKEDAWPCGFIAKFTFTDQFQYVKSLDRSFSAIIDESDIALSVDKDTRFKRNEDKSDEGAYWFDPENEHVMVWYQMESLRDFVKLYGRIDGPIKKGKEYMIAIEDNWASDKLDNEKSIVFSEVGTFGGKNYILAYFFAGAAAITVLVLIFFCIGFCAFVSGRRIEEESYIQNLKY